MNEEVVKARAYLEGSKVPVSSMDLIKETGINKHDLPTLERNGVLNAWYRLTNPGLPMENYLKNFPSGSSPYPSYVKKIIQFMKEAPDKIWRKHEILDSLGIDLGDGQSIFCTLQSYYLVETFFTLAPENDCQICYYREKCKKDIKKVSACQLFRDDWRLSTAAEEEEKNAK